MNHRRRLYLWPDEPEVILALVRSVLPKRVLEIGINDGRTASLLLENVSSIEQYVGVDVLPNYRPALRQQRREVVHEPGRLVGLHRSKLKLVVTPRGTFDAGGLLKSMGPFDAIFVDGDHGAQAVLHDSELAKSLIAPGGVIVWHDYHSPQTDVAKVLEHPGRRDGLAYVERTHVAFLHHTENV